MAYRPAQTSTKNDAQRDNYQHKSARHYKNGVNYRHNHPHVPTSQYLAWQTSSYDIEYRRRPLLSPVSNQRIHNDSDINCRTHQHSYVRLILRTLILVRTGRRVENSRRQATASSMEKNGKINTPRDRCSYPRDTPPIEMLPPAEKQRHDCHKRRQCKGHQPKDRFHPGLLVRIRPQFF